MGRGGGHSGEKGKGGDVSRKSVAEKWEAEEPVRGSGWMTQRGESSPSFVLCFPEGRAGTERLLLLGSLFFRSSQPLP